MTRTKTAPKKRTNKNRKSRRRRGRAKMVAHVIRGVILEGMGVVVLAMLYVMIQSTSASEVLEKGEQRSVGVDVNPVQSLDTKSWQQVHGSHLPPPSTFKNGYVYSRDLRNDNASQRQSIGDWR